ncbi:ABC transporter substrate-binding protein [Microbacterium sp. MAHUQ-60]|uniref:ABC transporter substrate-binding protein n=1 Tax=unclassified Microbacterium TaxID=2609290 RepID=UPI00361F050B
MNSKHRRLLAASIMAATLAVGTACSATPAAEQGDVTLQWWTSGGDPETANRVNGELIKRFEEQNPEIKVELLYLPGDSAEQKISNAVSTGSVPDILDTGIVNVSNLTARDAVEPLDDWFAQSEYAENIPESALANARTADPDGKLYFTPTMGLANVLWYRKDLLADAGVAEPKSWDDFYEVAEKMTDADKGVFGYIIRGGNGFFPQLLDAMYGQSGVSSFIDDDGKSTLNDPRNVAALERYVEMYGKVTAKSDLNADYLAMVAQFGAGKGVMFNHNLGSYTDNVKKFGAENVAGVQPFPSEAGPVTVSGQTILGNAIMKGSEHKEEAWKFVDFLMKPENVSYISEELGYIPMSKPAFDDAWVKDRQPLVAAIAAIDDPQTQVLHEPFYLPEYQTIAKVTLQTPWQQVLQGQLSVKKFLDQAADLFTEAEAAYRDRNGK